MVTPQAEPDRAGRIEIVSRNLPRYWPRSGGTSARRESFDSRREIGSACPNGGIANVRSEVQFGAALLTKTHEGRHMARRSGSFATSPTNDDFLRAYGYKR